MVALCPRVPADTWAGEDEHAWRAGSTVDQVVVRPNHGGMIMTPHFISPLSRWMLTLPLDQVGINMDRARVGRWTKKSVAERISIELWMRVLYYMTTHRIAPRMGRAKTSRLYSQTKYTDVDWSDRQIKAEQTGVTYCKSTHPLYRYRISG